MNYGQVLSVAIIGFVVGGASGQGFTTVTRSAPDADRWNYPFNATPGTKETAPTFGAVLIEGFDDRDSQFLVAFETEPEVVAGLALDRYHLRSVTVTATVSNDLDFLYDPTPDPFGSYLDPGDPEFVADADAGRAVELFGVGFRNGVTSAGWTETSAFGGAAVVAPAQGARNVFAAVYDGAGVATDVSNNLKDRFEASPWATGTVAGVAPGQAVPVDTTFTFEIDLCEPGVHAYLRRALAEGRVILTITSLQSASGGPGGGDGVVYPVWYTRENVLASLLGLEATLELEVRVGEPADLTGDGVRNLDDVSAFASAFISSDPAADLDANCALNLDDVSLFIASFTAP